jgi:hypothetical protein
MVTSLEVILEAAAVPINHFETPFGVLDIIAILPELLNMNMEVLIGLPK